MSKSEQKAPAVTYMVKDEYIFLKGVLVALQHGRSKSLQYSWYAKNEEELCPGGYQIDKDGYDISLDRTGSLKQP